MQFCTIYRDSFVNKTIKTRDLRGCKFKFKLLIPRKLVQMFSYDVSEIPKYVGLVLTRALFTPTCTSIILYL